MRAAGSQRDHRCNADAAHGVIDRQGAAERCQALAQAQDAVATGSTDAGRSPATIVHHGDGDGLCILRHIQRHLPGRAVSSCVVEAFLRDAVDVDRDGSRQSGDLARDLQLEHRARSGLQVVFGDQLAQAGLEPDLLDVLRAQTNEGTAQGLHHSGLGAADGLGFLDDVLSVDRSAGFDGRG